MRILDLFCGAGGCSMGYAKAGFEVIGVDLHSQPNYPFEFHRADAMTYPLGGFDVIHASPPCKGFTTAGAAWSSRIGPASERHPDLLTPTRERLVEWGGPYVIENTPGAPMTDYIVLCGLSFGLNVKRHRLFESNLPLWSLPCPSHDKDYVIVFGGGVRGRAHQIGRTKNGAGGPIIRRPTLPLEVGQEAMGIDWMNRTELSQAIPPAYTEFIGKQIIEQLERVA